MTRAAKAAKPRAKAAKGAPASASSDTFVASMEAWQQDIVRPFAALVAKVAPGASSYVKWGHPVWDHRGPFALTKPAKAHVTIGFWRGAQLRDVDGVLEGDGAGMRYVRVRAGEPLPPSLAALVREAVALNEKHGDPLRS